jgi:hypothetical protein
MDASGRLSPPSPTIAPPAEVSDVSSFRLLRRHGDEIAVVRRFIETSGWLIHRRQEISAIGRRRESVDRRGRERSEDGPKRVHVERHCSNGAGADQDLSEVNDVHWS